MPKHVSAVIIRLRNGVNLVCGNFIGSVTHGLGVQKHWIIYKANERHKSGLMLCFRGVFAFGTRWKSDFYRLITCLWLGSFVLLCHPVGLDIAF